VKTFNDFPEAMTELRKHVKQKRKAHVPDRPAKPSAQARAIAVAARLARLVRSR
jgi:hypothetical protein